jgi:hypothetical protein
VSGTLRHALRNCHFSSDHDLKEAMHTWLAGWKQFFKAYINFCSAVPKYTEKQEGAVEE